MGEVDGEPLHPQRSESLLHDEEHLEIGRRAVGSHDVEVALHELPVAAPLGVLSTEHLGDVVPPEGKVELGHVLGPEPGERHREIEPERDVPTSVVGETVYMFSVTGPGFLAGRIPENL